MHFQEGIYMCLKNCIIVLSLPSKPLTCVTNRTLGEGGITLRLKHHKASIVATYIYIDNVHSTNDLVGIFFCNICFSPCSWWCKASLWTWHVMLSQVLLLSLCKVGPTGIPNCILLTEKAPKRWGLIIKSSRAMFVLEKQRRAGGEHVKEKEASKLSQLKTLMNFECCCAKEKAMQYNLYLERRLQCRVFNAASPFITELPECSLSGGSIFAFKFPSFCTIDTPSKYFFLLKEPTVLKRLAWQGNNSERSVWNESWGTVIAEK